MPSHRFVVIVARGLWLTLVPAEAAPSPLGGDSERKIYARDIRGQMANGSECPETRAIRPLEKTLIEPA